MWNIVDDDLLLCMLFMWSIVDDDLLLFMLFMLRIFMIYVDEPPRMEF